MLKAFVALVALVAAVFGVYAYAQRSSAPAGDASAAAIETVTDFGAKLQYVPLTADPAVVRDAMDEHYAPLVTALLLSEWKDDPTSAPGRQTSSPWPARIEPLTVALEPDGSYTVTGRVMEITSEELVKGGAASTYDIQASVVREDDAWRIASFERM